MCSSEKSLKEKAEMAAEKGIRRSSLTIIFRYADWLDILLMLLGTFGAIGDGMSTNCLLVYVSRLFNSLGYGKSPQNHVNFMDEIEKVSINHKLTFYASFLINFSFILRFLSF